MMFLIGFVQYWIVGAMKELYKERKAKKDHENRDSDL